MINLFYMIGAILGLSCYLIFDWVYFQTVDFTEKCLKRQILSEVMQCLLMISYIEYCLKFYDCDKK